MPGSKTRRGRRISKNKRVRDNALDLDPLRGERATYASFTNSVVVGRSLMIWEGSGPTPR